MVEGADFLETNSSSSSPWPTDMDMEFVVVECVIFGGGGGGEKGGFPFPRWGKDDDMFLLLLPSTKVDFVFSLLFSSLSSSSSGRCCLAHGVSL